MPRAPLTFVLAVVLVSAFPAAHAATFRRADANSDGRVDILDPLTILAHLFAFGGGTELSCLDAADANDDGKLDLADAVSTLAHLFTGGPAPPAPGSACGTDPTDDELGCEASSSCAAAGPATHHARVEASIVWTLEAGALDELSVAERERLTEAGVVIEGERVISAAMPLAGRIIEVDGRRRQIAADGSIRFDGEPRGLRDVPVYWQGADTRAAAAIPELLVVPIGEEPAVTSIELAYEPPADMDGGAGDGGGGGSAGPPRAIDGCPLRTLAPGCPRSNAAPCCEDYLGPGGDGQPRWRASPPGGGFSVDPVCAARAYRNFVGSTCFEWVFISPSRACFPEVSGGPSCWFNHKYRNCQNLSETDFSLFPEKKTVKFGEELRFKVRNNTPANSTFLRIEPAAGELRLATGPQGALVRDGGSGGWRLDHFSDGDRVHFEELTVIFKAPDKDPGGKCLGRYVIHAQAEDLTDQFKVLCLPRVNRWQGRATGSEHTNMGGSMVRFDSTAQVTYDLDAGTVSGTFSVESSGSSDSCTEHLAGSVPITSNDETFLDIDYEAEPPTYDAGGTTTLTIRGMVICDDSSFSTELLLERHPWIFMAATGRLPVSEDGCTCEGAYSFGAGGVSLQYDWKLDKVREE